MIFSIEEGRKQDGNRSIADKIIKRLHDLKKTVENNQGRWVWELLQNAKDSISEEDNRSVIAQIILDEKGVEFKHNGTHFTEQDVRGVINQITSKEVEEGHQSKKTGRFGTGFLTTHLLSEIVEVKGILEAQGGHFYKFSFLLDRQGATTSQLIPKIESAWKDFHNSAKKIEPSYKKDDLNTSFYYQLTTETQKQIAKIGIEEFTKLIPYVLIFNRKIGKIEIINNINKNHVIFENTLNDISDELRHIAKIENNVKQTIYMLSVATADKSVHIAAEVERKDNEYAVKNIDDIPKLFCDFPLIGTENFHFPIVVNSFYFNPQTERDGVWLKGEDDKEVLQNQGILVNALGAYKYLIEQITTKKITKLFNIVDTRVPATNEKYFDEKWFKASIQKPMRDFIISQKIIEIPNGQKKSFEEVRIPSKEFSNEESLRIYQFYSVLMPDFICLEQDINGWRNKTWKDCLILDYQRIVNSLEGCENMIALSQKTQKDMDTTFEWYNNLNKFILEKETNIGFYTKHSLTSNQNGVFKKKNNDSGGWLLYIDRIKDEKLIEALKLLGEDWRDLLLHENVSFGHYLVKEKKDIANRITEKLKKANFAEANCIKAIVILSEWFEYNQEEGKELFAELYAKRAELFMNTIEDKENLYKIMRSGADLGQVAEVAEAIANDPEILDIIAKRKQKRKKERERNEIGEKVERILAEVLKQYGFEVSKVDTGADLIIKIKGKTIEYEIEVKSTSRKSWVAMTSTQAETAVYNSSSYFLCVVYKDGSPLSQKYIKENSKFVANIGGILQSKVHELAEFENYQESISNTEEDIDLLFENTLEYKYKIGLSIWQKGITLEDFVDKIQKY